MLCWHAFQQPCSPNTAAGLTCWAHCSCHVATLLLRAACEPHDHIGPFGMPVTHLKGISHWLFSELCICFLRRVAADPAGTRHLRCSCALRGCVSSAPQCNRRQQWGQQPTASRWVSFWGIKHLLCIPLFFELVSHNSNARQPAPCKPVRRQRGQVRACAGLTGQAAARCSGWTLQLTTSLTFLSCLCIFDFF